jgi:hypothetical protein
MSKTFPGPSHQKHQNRIPKFRRDADTVAETTIASHNDACDNKPSFALLWR